MAVNQSLTLTLVSQNIEENTSRVRILWQSVQTGGSYNMTTRSAKYFVSHNGGAETETAISYVLPYQSTVTLADSTLTVSHDAEGNGSLSVRTWMNTNISAGTIELSKTLTLPQIPRASTVSAADGVIGGTARIAVGKKSSSFSHSIAYQFGTLSGYVTAEGGVSAGEVIFSSDSVDFLLPESFYYAIPDSAYGVCTLTLRTYHGGSQIGQSQSTAFTVRTDASVCGPVVSGTVEDTNAVTGALTGNGSLVRYHSDALCNITATARMGASIVEQRIGGVAVAGDSRTIQAVETGQIVFYAKDSRGYESYTTVSVPMIPYTRLTNNAAVLRDDPTSGKATLTLQGQCYQGSFGAAENALTAAYQIDGGEVVPVTPTGSYQAVIPLTDMDYEKTYTLTVTVSDCLETAVKTLTLQKGIPVFDWGETDFAFHVPVTMDTPLSVGSGGTGRNAWTSGMVISGGTGLETVAIAGGALYAAAPNAAPRFGVLPVAQGGTGAETPDAARIALGAAPAVLTGEMTYTDTMEQMEEQLKLIYLAMPDSSSKFVVSNINGVVYNVWLWKADNSYGNVQMDHYVVQNSRRRVIFGGVWQPWEYPNPAMILNEEYRTTERWQEKPVYTKLMDFGNLPNCATKTVAHGCSAKQILRTVGQASNGQAFPICGSGFYNIELRAGTTSVDIYTDYNYSAYTATVQLWYTKE